MAEVVKNLENIAGWFSGAPYTRQTIKEAVKTIRELESENSTLKQRLMELQDDGK